MIVTLYRYYQYIDLYRSSLYHCIVPCLYNYFCILTVTGPPALTVNIMKSIKNLSIVVQWDAVDDFFHTTYTVTWSDWRDLNGADTADEQTSYTITGLTIDTVYAITVTAANRCGDGPEFKASVSFPIGTGATISTMYVHMYT